MMRTSTGSRSRNAAAVLRRAGRSAWNPKLIQLATRVRRIRSARTLEGQQDDEEEPDENEGGSDTAGGVEQVKAGVAEMIEDLKVQKQDKIDTRELRGRAGLAGGLRDLHHGFEGCDHDEVREGIAKKQQQEISKDDDGEKILAEKDKLPAAGAGEQEQTPTEGARDYPERHAELLVEAPRAPLSHPYLDRLKYLEMEGANDVKHKEVGGEEPAKSALRRWRSST